MNAEAIESMPCLEYSALTLLWCRLFFYGCLPPANQMWGCHGWHVLSTWGCLFLRKTLVVIILKQRGWRTTPLWNLYLRMVSFAFAVGLFNLADMNCWGWPAFCERLWVDLFSKVTGDELSGPLPSVMSHLHMSSIVTEQEILSFKQIRF